MTQNTVPACPRCRTPGPTPPLEHCARCGAFVGTPGEDPLPRGWLSDDVGDCHCEVADIHPGVRACGGVRVDVEFSDGWRFYYNGCCHPAGLPSGAWPMQRRSDALRAAHAWVQATHKDVVVQDPSSE